LTQMKEAPSRLTEAGLSDPKSRFFRLYPRAQDAHDLLQISVVRNDEPMVRLLLDHGARVNAKALPSGMTALMFAARMQREGLAQLLIEHGADVRLRDAEDHDALQAAVLGGSLTCIAVLVRAGADPNAPSSQPPLHLVAALGRRSDLVSALVKLGADVNLQDAQHGRSPLQIATERRDRRTVQALPEQGADPNLGGATSALARAKALNDAELIALLTSHAGKAH
jgi:ankyrin repeat protein